MSDCHVLVVDDDPYIRDVVCDALQIGGYSARAASNGESALTLVQQCPPDVILLDMRMPGLTGWDVARALKGRGVHVPIITMTAAANARQWASEIEAEAYLAKPFDLDDLFATVERFCPHP